MVGVLAKICDGTVQSALDGFSEAHIAIHSVFRKTSTCEQGRDELTKATDRANLRGGVFFRPTQSVAARIEREPQRAAAPIFSE